MVGAKQLATTGVGVGGGVGSTLLIRQSLDQNGETSVFRPSVLWGLVTGVGALSLPMVVDQRRSGTAHKIAMDYGSAAVASGLFSMFAPKGMGVQLPTL